MSLKQLLPYEDYDAWRNSSQYDLSTDETFDVWDFGELNLDKSDEYEFEFEKSCLSY